ncbi:MAG: TIM barrel protein [Pirellulaceae bacterium]|jgi:hydroxypyruvate isomerase|nr:TIM barrel protein [Pirellulaceae bacterium]MDP7019003.1 TIM barrel protein [Pirellulaceae bacterium]
MSKSNRREFIGVSAAALGAASVGIGDCRGEGEADTTGVGNTPHTKFAPNLEMWWTKLPFLDRVRKAAEYGFLAFEMWPYENKDLEALVKLKEELKIELAQFTAWGFSPGMNNPNNEDKVIAKLEESCAVAHKLNCKKMTVVAGNLQKGMTQEQMLAQVTKTLKRAAPILEKNKVMAILEPMNGRVDHPGHCLYGSPDALKICREVDSEFVKINWDLYHMQITEGDLCGRMKEGIDQIGYLQLADHPGRNEPGTGEIHYNRVLREALELGYEGYVGLECRPKTNELAAAKAVAAADVW